MHRLRGEAEECDGTLGVVFLVKSGNAHHGTDGEADGVVGGDEGSGG